MTYRPPADIPRSNPDGPLSKHQGYTSPRRYVPSDQMEAYAEEWPDLREHIDHGAWEIVGPCVYCNRCNQRLFQKR